MRTMNFVKKVVSTIGALVLVAVLIAALAPKATHGLVAALVQVTNTTANPASTWDADHATRIPYQDYQSFSPTYGSGLNTVQVVFAQVPAGYRLVIENVNAFLFAESGNPIPNACIVSFFNESNLFPCVTGNYSSADGVSIMNQQAIRYIGQGDTPVLDILADFEKCSNCDSATLTGYLEDCAVTGCPAPVN